jgi:hypothetical protein
MNRIHTAVINEHIHSRLILCRVSRIDLDHTPSANFSRVRCRCNTDIGGLVDGGLAVLTIRGEKQTNGEEKKSSDLLYQGIAARAFERSFQLADYVKVKGASLENGLLHVDLVREIPEAMKPRSISIRLNRGRACPGHLAF